jgi:DNA-binding NtrC family response regulator
MEREPAAILVIDDDPLVREGLQETLEAQGYEVKAAADGESGLALLKEQSFALVLSDLALPGLGGLEVLQHLTAHHPHCLCIIITGFGSIKTAVDSMRLGAFDYLTKPVDPQELQVVVAKALEVHRLKRENLELKRQLRQRYHFGRMVGDSEAMIQVFDLIRKVADSDSTVLLLGESGTGKELIAHALHCNSSRRERPLVPVNCAAIPEELLESELFGHERGAFTHAVRTRVGRFELAHGGTVFLDEIAEMSPGLQAKILRVLQDRAFERIGGVKTIRVDIRVIAATNQDLEARVAAGKFREDLYYRLNVIPIKIPPLRERLSDLPLLAHHFLEEIGRKKKKPGKRLSPEALELLGRYPWPGNVRELENLMERLVLLTEGDLITPGDLPERYRGGAPATPVTPPGAAVVNLTDAVQEYERGLILKALEESKWVKARAAQLLNLNRTTLLEKMKKQGIPFSPPGPA